MQLGRYAQSCENHRRDVITVGLPVLSYAWYSFSRSRQKHLCIFSSARGQPHPCRYPKHIKEFEQRDAARRVANNLPKVSYPVYPAPVYQPYSFYLPGSYRINEFYEANWRRYPGGIFSSGGMAEQDKSHTDKYVFISNGFVDRVFKTMEWESSNLVSFLGLKHDLVQDCNTHNVAEYSLLGPIGPSTSGKPNRRRRAHSRQLRSVQASIACRAHLSLPSHPPSLPPKLHPLSAALTRGSTSFLTSWIYTRTTSSTRRWLHSRHGRAFLKLTKPVLWSSCLRS